MQNLIKRHLQEIGLRLTPDEMAANKQDIKNMTKKGMPVIIQDKDKEEMEENMEKPIGKLTNMKPKKEGMTPPSFSGNRSVNIKPKPIKLENKVEEKFESKAQQKKCYALKNRGEAGSWDCDEWSEKTNFKKIPEKKNENITYSKTSKTKKGKHGYLTKLEYTVSKNDLIKEFIKKNTTPTLTKSELLDLLKTK